MYVDKLISFKMSSFLSLSGLLSLLGEGKDRSLQKIISLLSNVELQTTAHHIYTSDYYNGTMFH